MFAINKNLIDREKTSKSKSPNLCSLDESTSEAKMSTWTFLKKMYVAILYICTQQKASIFATNMKKSNILLGLILSIAMTVIATIPRFGWERNSMAGAALYSFIFSMVVWFAHLYLINNRWLSRKINQPFWQGFISIVLVAFLSYFLCDRILSGLITNLYHIDGFQKANNYPGLLFARNIFRSIIYYSILFTQKTMEEKKNNEMEIQRLKQLQLEAKLTSLKEQLSPHFLFNTLNTLSTLTKEKEAQNYIAELSKIYRYVLQFKNKEVVELKQELSFVESYWYILQMRFGEAIHLKIDVQDEWEQAIMPPLSLQLLIENTVKHNIASLQKPLFVHIYGSSSFLIVENNHQPRKSELPSTGEGLSNIAQQYQILFNQTIDIKKDVNNFSVSLPIIKTSNH
jgi:two-component system, LytTR family, sensor kinase